ncbi:MAG: hypothetical protein ACJ8HI_04390 [Massilia sp.]
MGAVAATQAEEIMRSFTPGLFDRLSQDAPAAPTTPARARAQAQKSSPSATKPTTAASF